jgi:hypothetical protein
VDPVWRRKLYLDAPEGNTKKQELGRAKQKLGAFNNQEMRARPSSGKTQPKPQTGQDQRVVTPTEMARDPKMPKDLSGRGTYKEALTNIKIAISKESYPEDKLNEDDQKNILEELGKVLRRTPSDELPLLNSYRLEGGALIYIYIYIYIYMRRQTVWSMAYKSN